MLLAIKKLLGKKQPHQITEQNIIWIIGEEAKQRTWVVKGLMKNKSIQTVKHVANVLTQIINYGIAKNRCKPLSFKVQKPPVANEQTEKLEPHQLKALLQAIEADKHPVAPVIMKLAMLSGLRRGEMLKLKWNDISFTDSLIYLRNPKGGKPVQLAMSPATANLLKGIPKTKGSPLVFPNCKGKERKNLYLATRKIADNAGLSKDFRPLHGLRHHYARTLLGFDVPLYKIQKLLSHKSPIMTQRYAKFKNDDLVSASSKAAELLEKTLTEIEQEKDKQDNNIDSKHHIAHTGA
jgi:integrase